MEARKGAGWDWKLYQKMASGANEAKGGLETSTMTGQETGYARIDNWDRSGTTGDQNGEEPLGLIAGVEVGQRGSKWRRGPEKIF